MKESTCAEIIKDETNRALWEVENVIACIPDELWDKSYCEMPLWKHIYHMLHSLDQWYINPRVYIQPSFHERELNNLDVQSKKRLNREDIGRYFDMLKRKITDYNDELTDNILLQKPEKCEWTRFTLILAQHRHLHSHMGMLMGFVIEDTGMWPKTLGLERPIPDDDFGTFF
ncbi:hypothetical protein [Caproicibacter sp.]|uniref:hypothetical protein n=1 Tax=Caproicibacter sp. TaxID=2814884 RepID=UPI0039894C29